MNFSSAIKLIPKALLALGAVLLLVSCASGPAIKSDYDYRADFSRFKTYGFYTPMGIENPNYSSIYGSVFRDAISKEMNARGYNPSDNPDLMFNVSAYLRNKTRVTTTTEPHPAGGYYGYRGGRYGAWGGYGYDSTTHVSNYTAGTINVDMVDRVQKRMVWEGVARGRLKQKASIEESRAAIYSGVHDMFATYPFRAGQQ